MLKQPEDKDHFLAGLAVAVKRLKPSAMVVYGSAPDSVFGVYRDMGISIIQFDSDFAVSHKAVE